MNHRIRLLCIVTVVAGTAQVFAGWQLLNSGTNGRLNCVTVHHSSPMGKVWTCGDGGVILYSSNGGDSWVFQNSGTNANLYTITFKEVAGGPVFAAGANGVILRTTDDGTTWTQIPSGTTATLRDHSDFGWIIVGDSGIVLRSTDNGLSWSRKQSGTNARLHSVAGAFSLYAVGDNGTLVKGSNGGETWQAVNTGMEETLLGVPMFGNLNYIVGSAGLILHSTSFGSSWNVLPSRTNATLRSVEFSVNNTSRIYAVGDNGTILKTTDGGALWGRQESPTRADLRSVFFYLNDNIGFACGDSGIILRTTDGGGSFITVADSLKDMFPFAVGNQWEYDYRWFYDDYFSGIYTSMTGSGHLTVTGVERTTDSTRWLMKELSDGIYCTRYWWPPGGDTCYARRDSSTFELIERHSWRHRLYRNMPYYNYWSSLVPFGIDLTQPAFIYRYYFPDSAGTTSVHVQDGPPYSFIQYRFVFKADSGIYAVSSQSLLVGVSFGSNHRLRTGILLDVAEREQVESPGEFFLFQNYPNPFNPSTRIVYRVGSRQSVELRVFDVLGGEVATLVNEMKEPGMHEVWWDATGYSSGVYFYRLQTGGFVQTRKLLLLR